MKADGVERYGRQQSRVKGRCLLIRSCDAFNCKPYFAIVVDQIEKIRAFILPMDEMINLYPKGKRSYQWRMAPKYLETYKQNPRIVYIEFDYATHSWFTKDKAQNKY